MNRQLLTVAILAATGFTASAAEFRTVQNPVRGQYIVVLKNADSEAITFDRGNTDRQIHAEDMAVDMGARYGVSVERVYESALNGFVAKASKAQLNRLLADPRVAFVEQDGWTYPNVTQSGATWGIDRIDQRDLPLNGTYIYDTAGAGVRAYVIDTGIVSSHNEFGGRVQGGTTFVNDGLGTSDCNGHGTHVSGTLGGATYGVAKSVTLVPVRVFACTGGATNSTVAAALDWVRTNHVKPAVVNMSLGGPANSIVDTATNNLINAGVTVVAAAGNDNQTACNASPARVANAITVGSTTSTDARSSFSNFGTCVDLFAPGSSITSAWWTSNSASNTISGTSMASPHAAGVAALYLGLNPGSTPATVQSAIVNGATTGKVTSPGTGSPNRLLYSRFFGSQPSLTASINCEFTGLIGGSGPLYWCSAFAAGGTAPYSYEWGGVVTGNDESVFAEAQCPWNTFVSVIVRDAAGGFVQQTSDLSCEAF